jgi:uncharacterized protein DUF6636
MKIARVPLVACGALAATLALAVSPAAAGLTQFQSPSENIGCLIDWSAKSAFARCDARHHSWHPRRHPGQCPDLDYGQGLYVTRGASRGRVVCAGDTALGAGKHLRYGHTISHGGIKCVSEKSGMTCRNRRGHGFFISRQRYRLL